MAATCIQFVSNMWSAMWYRATQDVMRELGGATAQTIFHIVCSTSTLAEISLLVAWIGQSSSLW